MTKTLTVELPRSFLQRFLRVFRKGGLHRTPKASYVEVRVRDNVVTLRSANNVLDLEYRWECHQPTPDWTFCVSPDVLSICGARLADKVTFEEVSPEVVRAHWFDAGVPQEAEFTLLPPGPAPIATPEQTTTPQRLLAALKDAADSVDPLSSRYALGCIELSGEKKRIAATDSRQLLVQEGFDFPWDGVRLMRSSPVFGASDWPVVGNVASIGESGVVRLERHLSRDESRETRDRECTGGVVHDPLRRWHAWFLAPRAQEWGVAATVADSSLEAGRDGLEALAQRPVAAIDQRPPHWLFFIIGHILAHPQWHKVMARDVRR